MEVHVACTFICGMENRELVLEVGKAYRTGGNYEFRVVWFGGDFDVVGNIHIGEGKL